MASEHGTAAFYNTALNSPDPTIVSDNHKSRVVDRSNVAAEENSKQYQKTHYRRQWDGRLRTTREFFLQKTSIMRTPARIMLQTHSVVCLLDNKRLIGGRGACAAGPSPRRECPIFASPLPAPFRPAKARYRRIPPFSLRRYTADPALCPKSLCATS